ncbi:MAG: type II toxin-antitoxin system RatA family toxin [Thiohalomonadaceae bacterium]
MSHQQFSRLLPYTCEHLFDLVLAIERYPEFVPGYSQARILRREAGALEVEQSIGLGPASFSFRSRAEFIASEQIFICAHDGPFRRLEVRWQFAAQQEGGCRVTVDTHYQPGHLLAAPLLRGAMELLGPRLLDAFVQRAAQMA